MEISRLNYEVFFIDYFDGSLSEEQVSSLMLFLEQNPDLKAEFDGFENIELKNDNTVTFPNKELLKVPEETVLPITETNFEWFCIAHYEKDLSLEQEVALVNFLKENPDKQKDFNQYSKTILEADKNIVFEKPERLKHHFAAPYFAVKQLWSYASAAAVVFIIAGLFFLMPRQTSEIEMAITKDINKSIPEATIDDTIETEIAETIETKPEEAITKSEKTQKTPVASRPSETTTTQEEMPKPLLASQLEVKSQPSLIPTGQKKENIKTGKITRTYGTSSNKDNNLGGDQNYTTEDNSFSFAQTNESRESNSSIDFERIEDGIANRNRFNLWDLAAAGLAGLSNLTGTPLTVEKERDQQGNVVELALGDNFSISRK